MIKIDKQEFEKQVKLYEKEIGTPMTEREKLVAENFYFRGINEAFEFVTNAHTRGEI